MTKQPAEKIEQDPVRAAFISPKLNIKQALKYLDSYGRKTVFVVDELDRLLGSVTDGDIRRWILKDGNLSKPVTQIMNGAPVAFPEGTSLEIIKQKMVSREIDCIPVLDAGGSIKGIHFWTDFFKSANAALKQLSAPVVIMAGGEGKRLGPITRVLPKPLLPIGDKPMLEHIMDRFRRHGCRNFFISLNYKSSIVKAYLKDNSQGDKVTCVEEKKPLGTAGSLHLLKNKIRSSFFLINCDIILDADYADIMRFHKESGNKITMVASMKHYTIPYGICDIQKGGTLKHITEKPEYDLLVNTGMYVLEPETIRDIPKDSFFHITDLINRYLKKGKSVGVYPVSDKSWLDTGQINELHSVLERFAIT